MTGQSDNDKTQTHVVLTKGTMVSHYRIVERIGAGGMGEVYLAEDTELRRRVALKFLPCHLMSDKSAKARFTREAQATAALKHPNIVTIYEVSEHQGRPFFAMEHVEGHSLRDVMSEGELSIDLIIEYVIQMCEGLGKAHSSGVTHRDIKPSNIIIDTDGKPRILDFGLATIQGTTKLTKTGSTLGTIGYMSPEQLKGESGDQRSDLFSLGVILYEMITGRAPFAEEHEAAVIYSILNEAPEPVNHLREGVPDGLRFIIDKSLEKDAGLRYQTADELLDDLTLEKNALAAGIPSRYAWTRRRPVLRWLASSRSIVVGLAAVVAVMGAYVVIKSIIEGSQDQHDEALVDNRIVILPLEDSEQTDESMSRGGVLADLIRSTLAASPYIEVVSSYRLNNAGRFLSSSSMEQLESSSILAAVRDANCRYLLTGRILPSSTGMATTLQLTDAATGMIAWSERFTHDANDLMAVAAELCCPVLTAMGFPCNMTDELHPRVGCPTGIPGRVCALYLEGVRQFFIWEVDSARMSFRSALEIQPDLALAYCRLALSGGDSVQVWADRAREFSDKLSQADRLFVEAGYYWATNKHDKAIEVLEELIVQRPEDAEVYFWLGRSYNNLNSPDVKKGSEFLKKAIEIDSLFAGAYLFLALTYGVLDDFDKAYEAMNEYIRLAPGRARSYQLMGILCGEAGKLDEAVEAYRRAHALQPEEESFTSALGDLHIYRREYATAESYFRLLLNSKSRDHRAMARGSLALIQVWQGRFDSAVVLAEQAVIADKIDGAHPCWPPGDSCSFWAYNTNFLIGMILLEKKDTAAALAIELDAYGLDLNQKGWGKEADYYVAMLLAGLGEFAPANTVLAGWGVRLSEGHFADSSAYYFALGYIDLLRDDTEAALNDFAVASKTLPGPNYYLAWPVNYMNGIAHLKAGKLLEATEFLSKCSSTYPNHRLLWPIWGVKAHYYAGVAYEEIGSYDRAIAQYEEFLAIWANADLEIELVKDARERLARLIS